MADTNERKESKAVFYPDTVTTVAIKYVKNIKLLDIQFFPPLNML